jgi:flotillin
MKKIGYITASPAEFVIHQRLGKVRHQGRGISAWKWPLIDRYYILPATTNSISFAADQITAENQGVEVSGFAIWKISAPERTITSFDFDGTNGAIEKIGANLKDVVESAIRHQVANMTIEDVLRKRGSIILQLKQELAYISEQWGIVIETVEIKNVRIMSAQVFANMQAKFRDAVRLESETSSLETEKQIAETRYTQREHLALREQEFDRREAERKAEMARLAAIAAADLEALKRTQRKEAAIADFASQVETAGAETLKKKEVLLFEQEIIALQRDVQNERFKAETESKKQQVNLGEMEDALAKRRIETANGADVTLAFVNHLPAVASALQLKELHITEDTVTRLGRTLSELLTQGTKP